MRPFNSPSASGFEVRRRVEKTWCCLHLVFALPLIDEVGLRAMVSSQEAGKSWVRCWRGSHLFHGTLFAACPTYILRYFPFGKVALKYEDPPKGTQSFFRVLIVRREVHVGKTCRDEEEFEFEEKLLSTDDRVLALPASHLLSHERWPPSFPSLHTLHNHERIINH